MKDEFSVWQFFNDGTHEPVRRWVSIEEAMKAARHYCTSVAAKIGIVNRVIVTDGGDYTNFEWIRGKGVTFPPPVGKVVVLDPSKPEELYNTLADAFGEQRMERKDDGGREGRDRRTVGASVSDKKAKGNPRAKSKLPKRD